MLLPEDSCAPVHSAQRSNAAWTHPGQLEEHAVCTDVDGGLPHTSCHVLHADSTVIHSYPHKEMACNNIAPVPL